MFPNNQSYFSKNGLKKLVIQKLLNQMQCVWQLVAMILNLLLDLFFLKDMMNEDLYGIQTMKAEKVINLIKIQMLP
jgi:hypothetical protein